MKYSILLLSLFVANAFAIPAETFLTYKESSFSFYGSHDLAEKNNQIEQAIIVVHGSERNADTYYKSIEAMAKKFSQSDKTIIISTHFKESKDVLIPNELVFTEEGWLSGDQSITHPNISSFEIMDHLIQLVSNSQNFPNLKKIIITGHSAGGQLTQRFALSTVADKNLEHIKFKYIVANPGSYVYLTPQRPVSLPTGVLCPEYNSYKYGLENVNPYLGLKETKKMVAHYIQRDITYLVGENDTRSDDIDQVCQAVVQGNTRLERGQNFKMQLDQEFSDHQHKFFSIPGVGHTQWGMYTSEIGSKLLFN